MSIIFLLLMLIPLVFSLLLLSFIFLGIGVKNTITYFNLRRKVKKGFGAVRIFYPTGHPKIIIYDFKAVQDGLIQPLGGSGGQYIFKKKCVYINEFNIPVIEYMYGESEPLDPRSGLLSVTNPKILENIIAGAVRARTAGDIGGFMEFLKKYWWLPLVIIGGFLIMIYLMYDGQAQALQQCMAMGKSAVINTSTIGR